MDNLDIKKKILSLIERANKLKINVESDKIRADVLGSMFNDFMNKPDKEDYIIEMTENLIARDKIHERLTKNLTELRKIKERVEYLKLLVIVECN